MDEKRCILHCWKCPKASNAFSLFLEKNSYNFTWKLLPLAWPQSYFCAELFSRMGLPEHTVSYPFFHLSPPPPLPDFPTTQQIVTSVPSCPAEWDCRAWPSGIISFIAFPVLPTTQQTIYLWALNCPTEWDCPTTTSPFLRHQTPPETHPQTTVGH